MPYSLEGRKNISIAALATLNTVLNEMKLWLINCLLLCRNNNQIKCADIFLVILTTQK